MDKQYFVDLANFDFSGKPFHQLINKIPVSGKRPAFKTDLPGKCSTQNKRTHINVIFPGESIKDIIIFLNLYPGIIIVGNKIAQHKIEAFFLNSIKHVFEEFRSVIIIIIGKH